jgi:simple sugar transport system permease protein
MEFDAVFIVNWLSAAIRIATPLIVVSIGMIYTERSGVLMIGAEGMMLAGTFVAVAGAAFTGSVVLGSVGAMLVGAVLAAIFAYITVNRRGDQVVTGFGINILALGLTNVLARSLLADRFRVNIFPTVSIGALDKIPIIGPLLSEQSVVVWITLIIVLISSWILYKTTWGLNIRAVGEHPRAVAAGGLSVFRWRYVGIIAGGIFAGLGGAVLALGNLGYFVPNMTAGRAFIVLAAMIVGKWKPIPTAIVCIMFGAADALQLRMQATGSLVPHQLLLMIPYVLTVAALAGFVGRTVEPKAYAKPYNPEEA